MRTVIDGKPNDSTLLASEAKCCKIYVVVFPGLENDIRLTFYDDSGTKCRWRHCRGAMRPSDTMTFGNFSQAITWKLKQGLVVEEFNTVKEYHDYKNEVE